jgi:hypothetical protein
MADDDRLRDLFAQQPAVGSVDARAVIRRSRARRLPKQLAAGAIGALAVVGIGVIGVQSLTPQPQSTVMLEQGDSAAPTEEFAPDAAIKRAPAERLNLCEGTPAEVEPSRYGLRLDVAFPGNAPATGSPVSGVVRLTNTGPDRVIGTTAIAPSLTVSQDGIVLWHSTGAVDAAAVVVDLEPGQSLEYTASFTPVRCEVEDDARETFRPDLPPLAPGAYELSAAIDFAPGPSMPQGIADLDLVTGPVSMIRLE